MSHFFSSWIGEDTIENLFNSYVLLEVSKIESFLEYIFLRSLKSLLLRGRCHARE